MAQEKEVHRVYPDAGRGYWSLFTDPVKRRTVVKFFDKDDILMYEEALHERYLKLTPRTLRSLNDLHAWYVAGRLVSEHVRALALPPAETPLDPSVKQLQSNIFAIPGTCKFKIALENPTKKWVYIKLKDAQGRVMQLDLVKTPKYIRTFNMEGMRAGIYTLKLRVGTHVVERAIDLRHLSQRFVQIHTPSLPDTLIAESKRNPQR
ncbi:hypothetical protein [Catalinimonas alkaloidigena]|nr:hypothetical protein [Catalinimonas alkaloidigena]